MGAGEAGNASIHPLWLPSWVPPPPPNGLVFFAYDFHSSKYLRSFFKNSKPYKLVVPFPPKAPTLQRNHQTRRNQYPYCQQLNLEISMIFSLWDFVDFKHERIQNLWTPRSRIKHPHEKVLSCTTKIIRKVSTCNYLPIKTKTQTKTTSTMHQFLPIISF